jgi:hypothetical protein
MRKTWSTDTLAHAISEAFSEIFSLSEEMREAFDGTPESLKQSRLGRRREAAADLLEQYEPDVPKEFREMQVTWMEMCQGKDGKLFRPARRDSVVRCLMACVVRLSTQPDNYDANKLKKELQKVINILDSVDFPGMSG